MTCYVSWSGGLPRLLKGAAASILNRRAETEYRQLARGIVESEGWKSLPFKAGRARNRAIGRLMLRALNDE